MVFNHINSPWNILSSITTYYSSPVFTIPLPVTSQYVAWSIKIHGECILLLFLLSAKEKGGKPTQILLPLPSQDAKPFLFSHALEHISLRSVFVFQAIQGGEKKKKAPQLKQETLSFHSNRSKLEFPTC